MSSHFGYQGEALVTTPHINQLANHGVVFNNAYVSAPVCSASRSAFITGMYQTSISAHHHRSSRGKELVNKYSDRLFAYALSLSFDHSIASDIIQQVFINFYEFRYKLNPKYSIESFLHKSTYNKFITEHHKNKS